MAAQGSQAEVDNGDEEPNRDDRLLEKDAQWLQESYSELATDPELKSLSFLFTSDADSFPEDSGRNGQVPLNGDVFSKDTVTKTISSEVAAGEIQRLISLKKAVNNLLQGNQTYINSLEVAMQTSRQASISFNSMERYLERAALAEKEDEEASVLPVHAERVQQPRFPAIYQIPLLASQTGEVDRLRILVCSFPWSNDEISKLKRAVLNQCMRRQTLKLASSDHCPDNLLEIATKWTEKELSSIVLPSNDDEKEDFDWIDVSNHVGGTHTSEECRTRWLMFDRPGLKQGDWTEEETSQLKAILDRILEQTKDGIIRDWEAVATHLNSGRLGIDCFMQSQKEDLVPLYASASARAWSRVPMSDTERGKLQQLDSIWDDHSVIASRLDSSRPKSQITAEIATMKKMRDKPINWSARADNALIVFVAKENHTTRTKLFQMIDSISAIDFSKDYRRRPVGASAGAVEKRWNYIKQEQKKDPSRYLSKALNG